LHTLSHTHTYNIATLRNELNGTLELQVVTTRFFSIEAHNKEHHHTHLNNSAGLLACWPAGLLACWGFELSHDSLMHMYLLKKRFRTTSGRLHSKGALGE
jgi:hypothetical protein